MQSSRDGSGIDWSRTVVIRAVSGATCYVNLKGRDPHGIVDPADYDKVCAEIAKKLEATVDPQRREAPITKVWRRDEL